MWCGVGGTTLASEGSASISLRLEGREEEEKVVANPLPPMALEVATQEGYPRYLTTNMP